MKKPLYSIRCQSNLSSLAPLRSLIHETATQSGFTEKEIHEIEISVDEACANAIEHVPISADCESIEFQLEIFETSQELIFVISDDGCETFSGKAHSHNLEDYFVPDRDNFRGLGLMLMNKFMDEVCFVSSQTNGTSVKLIKKKK